MRPRKIQRVLIIVAIIVLIGASTLLMMNRPEHQHEPHRKYLEPSASAATELDSLGRENVAASADASSDRSAHVDGATISAISSPLEVERSARRLSEAVDQLLQRARDGEAFALAALSRLAGRCLAAPRESAEVPRDDQAGATIRFLQRQALERTRAFCDLPSDVLDEVASEVYLLEKQLRQDGDVGALARHFRTPESIHDNLGLNPDEVMEWALREIGRSEDPYVLQSTLELLFNRWDGAGLSIPRIAAANAVLTLDPRLALTPPHRVQEIRTLAIELLACDFGAPCAPQGPRQDYFCVVHANCATDLTMNEFVRQRLLTPPEYEALTRFLEALRRLAQAG